MSNNVIDFSQYKQYKQRTDWPSKEELERRVQDLIDEGLISSGHVYVNEHGIPVVYVVPNFDYEINTQVTFSTNSEIE